MPLPKPKEGESRGDFVKRCMSDDTLNSEFPDNTQRLAVCESQYDRAAGKSQDTKKVDKKEINRSALITPFDRLKIVSGAKNDKDPGWIEGYASVFNVPDYGGDIVRPGAFQKTIAERVPAGRVKLMAVHFIHGGGAAEVIGTVTQAKEDDYGLWIHADLSSTELAQQTRQKALEQHLKELSMGYKKLKYNYITIQGNDYQELIEVMLLEVTVVPFGMNEHALITAAKSAVSLGKLIGHDLKAPDKGRLLMGDKEAVQELKSSLDDLSQQLGKMLVSEPPGSPVHLTKQAVDLRLKEWDNWLFLQDMEV